MKSLKVLICSCIILLSGKNAIAQNPNALDAADGDPTEAVIVDADGQVGIGTQNPSFEFHVFTEFGAAIQQPLSIGGSSDYFVPDSPSLFVKRGSGTRGASIAIGNSTGRFYLYGNHSAFKVHSPSEDEVLRIDSDGNVGIGNPSPNAKLDVAGAIRAQQLCNENGVNCIDVDASNNLTFSDAVTGTKTLAELAADGLSQWDDVTGGVNFPGGNVGIGQAAPGSKLDVNDGDINVSGAYKIGNATALSRSSANLGMGVLAAASGSNNIFIGLMAGGDRTTSGSDNIFIGGDAGKKNTSGNQNIFIGENAGKTNTSGSDNVFIGDDAGTTNTIGRKNVFIGENAGLGNTTGKGNVFIGESAGLSNTTGEGNIFIGPSAGANAAEDETDMLYIDNSNTSLPLILGDFNADVLIFNGFVGISEDPDYAIELPNSNSVFGKGRAFAWITYSSERWKQNIKTIDNALAKIAQIRGVDFEWREENGGGHGLGFVAEEVGEIFPEVVDWEENGKDAMAMDYTAIIPVTVEAIKELKAENEALREIVCLDHPEVKICQ